MRRLRDHKRSSPRTCAVVRIVYAPFTGVIAGRNTDIDALINAGAGGTPQELFHMAAVNELRVYVAVPEADSQAVQTGAKSTLTLDEFTGETFHGKIVRAPDSIDYVQPAAMRAKRGPGGGCSGGFRTVHGKVR